MKEEREMRTSPWGLIPTARRQTGKQEVAATTAASSFWTERKEEKNRKAFVQKTPWAFLYLGKH